MSVFPLVVSPQFFEPQKFLASGRRGLVSAANLDFDARGTVSSVFFERIFVEAPAVGVRTSKLPRWLL
jgi:hypothetical protein